MKNNPPPTTRSRAIWLAPLLLLAVIALLFWRSFAPDYVHFSNDGPLGQQMVNWQQLPAAITGMWDDLNETGANVGAYTPSIRALIFWFLGPIGYSKFYAPISLFILGLGAWAFFRALKLSPLAATLGALAAVLSSTFFSGACWGIASMEIAIGLNFLALALIMANENENSRVIRWTRLALAGLCVGVNVIEAADVGALCSLLISGFILYKSLVESGGNFLTKTARAIGRIMVVAVFAGFIAFQAIFALIGSSITGVAGTGQDEVSKAANWDFATQWSLPKKETLGLIVPGLFGYKMDTPKDMTPALQDAYRGGIYWGGVGRSPETDRFLDKIFHPGDEVKISINTPDHPNQSFTSNVAADGNITVPVLGQIQVAGLSGLKLKEKIEDSARDGIQASVEVPGGLMRFTGGGGYCGVLVFLIAAWTAAQSFRRQKSPFLEPQKKVIWFWLFVLAISLPLAWGRFAPGSHSSNDFLFYALLYKLPYFSTIRNPIKFLVFLSWAEIILFAYGIHALSRQLGGTAPKSASLLTQLENWWKRASLFDRRWLFACGSLLGASVLGWLIFSWQQPAFVEYLQKVGFPDEAMARGIGSFSLSQVTWFLALLAAAIAVLTLVIAGYFSGARARFGIGLLGALLIFDLSRANLPYIIHWDYKQKYEVGTLNPIVEFLRDKPYEHRVASLPFEPQQQLRGYDNAFGGSGIYRIEWMQHHFPYYNIQCLDLIQMPRMAEDLKTYLEALSPHGSQASVPLFARRWQLSNTRYLLGAAGYLEVLNQQLDPVKHRFKIAQRFDLIPKPGVAQVSHLEELTAAASPDGDLALFDFTGALPRAKLYCNWQVSTNDPANLKTLADLDFDPAKTVLISTPQKDLPAVATNENSGTVEFSSYAPKKIIFDVNAAAPSVLLLNDKYDPHWRVTVDKKPAALLRCNFLMRGVQVPPGRHTVEFDYSLPSKPMYVTLAGFATGLCLWGFLLFSTRRTKSNPAG